MDLCALHCEQVFANRIPVLAVAFTLLLITITTDVRQNCIHLHPRVCGVHAARSSGFNTEDLCGYEEEPYDCRVLWCNNGIPASSWGVFHYFNGNETSAVRCMDPIRLSWDLLLLATNGRGIHISRHISII